MLIFIFALLGMDGDDFSNAETPSSVDNTDVEPPSPLVEQNNVNAKG